MRRACRSMILCIALMSVLSPMALAQLPAPREFCEEPFTISTVQLSPPGMNFPLDTEFDQVGFRVMWSRNNNVTVQALDPATGRPVGAFKVIDTGIAHTWPVLGLPLLGNGPEWGYSRRGSELYYMKPYGALGRNRVLWKARETSPGVWSCAALPEGVTKGLPWPSKNAADPVPRILYGRSPTGVQTGVPYDVAVRSVPEDPSTERVIPVPVLAEQGGPRWIPGGRRVIFSTLDTAGVQQVAIYDVDAGTIEQVTHHTAEDDVHMDETWTSEYPELGGAHIVWFVVNGTELRVLQKDGDSWVEANRVNPSLVLGKPEKPYIVSPEPLIYRGKPYIVFQLSATYSNVGQPSDIYLMQPQSSSACHFRLVTPDDNRARRGPEFLQLLDKLALYYIEIDGGTYTIHQAESGL